jgi:hypothetical protein
VHRPHSANQRQFLYGPADIEGHRSWRVPSPLPPSNTGLRCRTNIRGGGNKRTIGTTCWTLRGCFRQRRRRRC